VVVAGVGAVAEALPAAHLAHMLRRARAGSTEGAEAEECLTLAAVYVISLALAVGVQSA